MSKRKPNNMHRRYERTARAAVKNIGAAFVTGDDRLVECVNLKTLEVIKAGPLLARVITNTAFKWSVHICVLGIGSDGLPYVKGDTHNFAVRYKQANLVDYLNEQHQEYIAKRVNKNQMIAAGWIASPEGLEITNEQAMELFTKMGAFEA